MSSEKWEDEKNRSSLGSVDYANASDFGAIMSHCDWATRLIVLQAKSNCYKYNYKYKYSYEYNADSDTNTDTNTKTISCTFPTETKKSAQPPDWLCSEATPTRFKKAWHVFCLPQLLMMLSTPTWKGFLDVLLLRAPYLVFLLFHLLFCWFTIWVRNFYLAA